MALIVDPSSTILSCYTACQVLVTPIGGQKIHGMRKKAAKGFFFCNFFSSFTYQGFSQINCRKKKLIMSPDLCHHK